MLQGLASLISLCLFFSCNPFYWLLPFSLQMCSAFCYLNKTPSLVPEAMIPCITIPSTLPSQLCCSGVIPEIAFFEVTTMAKIVPLSSPSPGSLQGLTFLIIIVSEILSSLGFYDSEFSWFLSQVPKGSFKIVSVKWP